MTKIVHFVFFLILAALAPSFCEEGQHCPMSGEMTERGDAVMGFDHAKTTHHFRLAADGGAIEVAANDTSDQTSRDQIRMHLSHIAHMFSDGDFEAPLLVHDQNPPGADTMKQKKDLIRYEYRDTDHGGIVTLRSTDAQAISAIQEFLRFQIREHRTGDPTALP